MSPHTDDGAGIRAMEEVRAKFGPLFNSKKIEEMCDFFYAEDAVAIPPGLVECHGMASIKSLFHSWVAARDVTFELGIVETHCTGTTGYIIGTYVMTDRTDDEPVVSDGRTLEVYRLEPDGSWKCIADMWHNIS